MGATRAAVERALKREAAKLDAAHAGSHRFDPIQRTLTRRDGCNWTAGFHVIGSRLPLDDMQEALESVQRAMPLVDFGRSG